MQPKSLASFAMMGLLVAELSVAQRVPAALIAYEPFDYPAETSVMNGNGGFGFNSPWLPGGFNAKLPNLYRTADGVLDYPGLAMQGSTHVKGEPTQQGIGGLGRTFATPLGEDNTTLYLSFLHRPDGAEEYGSVVLGTGQGNELAVGKSSSTGEYYVSHRGGTGRMLSGVPGEIGKTRLVVVKMEFLPGPDRFTLFMDPTPGSAEPADGTVKEDLDLQRAEKIFLYSRAAWSVDELRLGTTWEDVTPAAPSPAVGTTIAFAQTNSVVSGKAIIFAAMILLALVIVIVALVIVWIIAYKRGQKSRGGGN